MKHSNLLLAALLCCTTLACGPDWGECRSCAPGESSAESVGGDDEIPVVVIVNVDVDVDNEQTQTQTQTQGQGQTTPPPVITNPPPPPECETQCRKVCTDWKWVWKCDNGNHYGRKDDCPRNRHCWKVKKCKAEALQCR